MGISDDIKPKKAIKETPQEEPEAIEDQNEQPPGELNGLIEIPIDKSGKNAPVIDDLEPSSDHSRPKQNVEHLHHRSYDQTSERLRPGIADDSIEDENEEAFQDEAPVERKDSFKSFADYHREQPKKSHLLTVIIVLFVILLAVLLVLQNYDQIKKLFGGSSSNSQSSTQSAPSVEVISNQDKDDDSATATVTNSSSASSATETPTTSTQEPATTSGTTTAAPSAPAATTKAPADVKIKVLNGNGITGSAAKVKDILVAAGYNIPGVSNASKFTYTITEIYFNTGLKAEADAVAALLSSRQTEVVENTSVTGTYDLVVVVGKS